MHPAMTADTVSDAPVDRAWATFRAYWLGLTVSTIGDSFTLVALPIAAYTIDKSSVLVGFVDMMEILSGILLGTVLGVLADRSDSRRVMFWCDAVRVVILAGLAAMAATHSWNRWTLLALAFGLGALRAFHDGAESSMLAVIVPPAREMQAFARISSAESISRLVGPFIGGLTLELGLWAAFGIDAMTFAIAALIVLTLPRRRAIDSDAGDDGKTVPLASIRDDLRTAIRAMRERPTYLAVVGVGAFGNLAGLAMAGLFVPFASEVLHVRALGFQFGLLLSLLGLGGIIANVYANRQTTHDPRTAGLSMTVVGLVVFVAGALPSLATSIIAMLVAGAAFGYYQANYAAYRQQVFGPEVLGRVSMATRTIFYVTMVVGLGAGGLIAEAWGSDRMFMLYGAISIVGTIAVGFVPLPIDPATGKTV